MSTRKSDPVASRRDYQETGLEENDPVLVDRQRWEELGWPNPSAMAACMSVFRLRQDVAAALHLILRDFDLSITEHSVLIHLSLVPANQDRLGRVAERLLIGPGRCNYVINGLEAKGLVRREAHPSDGRVTYATITAKGKKVLAAATEAVAAQNFGFGDISQDELDAIVADLTRARRSSTRGDTEAEPGPDLTAETG